MEILGWQLARTHACTRMHTRSALTQAMLLLVRGYVLLLGVRRGPTHPCTHRHHPALEVGDVVRSVGVVPVCLNKVSAPSMPARVYDLGGGFGVCLLACVVGIRSVIPSSLGHRCGNVVY